MNWKELSSQTLFTLSGTEVTPLSFFIFFLAIVASFAVSWVLQRVLGKALANTFKKRPGTLATLLRLVHYTVLLTGLGIGLQTVGVNMSALFATGAVFAIALGFAMQNIVQNFVSGIILMGERSITPGDVLEIDGTVVKVIAMGIRTTIVRTLRDEELIMPNSLLAQSMVKNFTLHDNAFRLGVTVGVSYDSDMNKVIEVLETTARNIPWRIPERETRVLMRDFGDSAVVFGVYLNIEDPWKQNVCMSDLRKEVWFALKDAGITIAYNQVDLHLDPPVTQALESLRKIG
jgi:small-conductance mechanosensitive channel